MSTMRFKFFGSRVLTAFLLVFSISLLSLTSCVEDNPHPEINLTFESDYSAIIAAINSMDRNLSEKLSLIESAAAAGFADSEAQQKLLQQAVESLSGSVESKLSAVEAAIKSQATSFESKLGLIEAAVSAGFADQQAIEFSISCLCSRNVIADLGLQI